MLQVNILHMKTIKIFVGTFVTCASLLLFLAHIPVLAHSTKGTATIQSYKDYEIEFLVENAEEIEVYLEEYSEKLDNYNAKKGKWSDAIKSVKKNELNGIRARIIAYFEQLWGDVHVFEEDEESISESIALLNKHLEKSKEKAIQFEDKSSEKTIEGLINQIKVLSKPVE